MQANNALLVLVPLFYLAAFMAYNTRLGKNRTRRFNRPLWVLFVALVMHLGLLVVRGMLIRQAPWTTYYDSFSVLAFLMTLTYAIVELWCKDSSTGYDFLPLPFALLTWSAAFGPHEPQRNEMLDSGMFVLHTVPAIGGMAALLVGGFYGLLYLRLSRAMQEKRFGDLFQRLPNLDTLARMNYASLVVGLLLVTAAIGWGATWYSDVFREVDITQPKIAFTLIVWVVLLVPVLGRLLVKRWSDRSTAICSVIVMGLAAVTILVSSFADFHGPS